MPITSRFHLFPSRTQKLSSIVPKILGWRRPGKIGRCRPFSFTYGLFGDREPVRPLGQAAKTTPSHGVIVGSIPAGVTKHLAAQPQTRAAMAPKGGPCGFCFLAKGAAARQQAGAATRGATLIYALLAQLVEQLTLNQRAQGSSPWKCTMI